MAREGGFGRVTDTFDLTFPFHGRNNEESSALLMIALRRASNAVLDDTNQPFPQLMDT